MLATTTPEATDAGVSGGTDVGLGGYG